MDAGIEPWTYSRRPLTAPRCRIFIYDRYRNDTISKLSIHYGGQTENRCIHRAFIAHHRSKLDWIDLRLPGYTENRNTWRLAVEPMLV